MRALENLKVGDSVCASTNSFSIRFAKVERLTATQAVLDSGKRILLASGREVGTKNSFHSIYWRIAKREDHLEYELAKKLNAAKYGLAGVVVTEKNVDIILGFLKHFVEEIKAKSVKA
jgi:hypothetical protein